MWPRHRSQYLTLTMLLTVGNSGWSFTNLVVRSQCGKMFQFRSPRRSSGPAAVAEFRELSARLFTSTRDRFLRRTWKLSKFPNYYECPYTSCAWAQNFWPSTMSPSLGRFSNFYVPILLLTYSCILFRFFTPWNLNESFLESAPSPPRTRALQNAITLLIDIGALDKDENLTDLGHQLVDLPIEPRLGKTVLASVVLKCLDPILTIVCSLSYRDPFIFPMSEREKRNLKELKRGHFSLDADSDHITLVKAFREWEDAVRSGSRRRNGQPQPADYLSFDTMTYIRNLREQLLGQLRAGGFVKFSKSNSNNHGRRNSLPNAHGTIRDCNVNSHKWSVVKAAMLCGAYPNIARIDEDTKQGLKVITDSSKTYMMDYQSVCSKAAKARHSKYHWFIFEEISQQLRGQLPMLKMVTPMTTLAVAIFAGSNNQVEIVNQTQVDASDSEYDEIRSDLGKSLKFILFRWNFAQILNFKKPNRIWNGTRWKLRYSITVCGP